MNKQVYCTSLASYTMNDGSILSFKKEGAWDNIQLYQCTWFIFRHINILRYMYAVQNTARALVCLFVCLFFSLSLSLFLFSVRNV